MLHCSMYTFLLGNIYFLFPPDLAPQQVNFHQHSGIRDLSMYVNTHVYWGALYDLPKGKICRVHRLNIAGGLG